MLIRENGSVEPGLESREGGFHGCLEGAHLAFAQDAGDSAGVLTAWFWNTSTGVANRHETSHASPGPGPDPDPCRVEPNEPNPHSCRFWRDRQAVAAGNNPSHSLLTSNTCSI